MPAEWGAALDPSAVLPEYPRPQLTRPDSTYFNMNGMWEWQMASSLSEPVPFGTALNDAILVPFPPEACLSGIGAFGSKYPQGSFNYAWYRLVFDAPFPASPSSSALLHFGAVDWNSTFWLNGQRIGSHVGGYDGFYFDVTSGLQASNNELIVFAHDPSDEGYQPHGKQRISAINSPSGDTYVPSSGIWQTVWLENTPAPLRIDSLRIRTDTSNLLLTVNIVPASIPAQISVVVTFKGAPVTTFSGVAGIAQTIPIPNPVLWNVGAPNLYDMTITATEMDTTNTDNVGSYFGMRVVSLLPYTTPSEPSTGPQVGIDRPGDDLPGSPFNLPSANPSLCWAACNTTQGCKAWAYGVPSCGGDPAQAQCWLKASDSGTSAQPCRVSGSQGSAGGPGMRPAINGVFTFLAGWLDQSWWPDGEYTAPSDAALGFDVQALPVFGFNSVRLHQKVNSERWYWYADTVGIAVQQDGVQKYGGATAATIEPFLSDWKAMVDGRGNHPSIYLWTVFNEGDCVGVFPNVTAVVEWAQEYDPSRLIDTNSGGPANSLGIGAVNDAHNYPYPGSPRPSATQYAEQGEFGGMGAFVTGHEWSPGKCGSYLPDPTVQTQVDQYVAMTGQLANETAYVSVSVCECLARYRSFASPPLSPTPPSPPPRPPPVLLPDTQLSDVERECDGFFNMDRTNKFSPAQTAQLLAANVALIASATG